MKAWRLHAQGSLDHLQLEEMDSPEPGPDEVLVKIRSIGLNSSELQFITEPDFNQPRLYAAKGLPFTPGNEGAGEVVAVGADVDSHKAGDLVSIHPIWPCGNCDECVNGWENTCPHRRSFGRAYDGAWREFAAVPARFALTLPEGVTCEAAAALATAAGTAWHMLVVHGNLAADETVLFAGGSSGIGTAGIQIAQDVGARVIATAGGPEKVQRLREMGVDLAIDHAATPDFKSDVLEWTGGRGVDVVFDARGGETFAPSLASLRPRGRLIIGGYMAGKVVPLDFTEAIQGELRIFGSARKTRATGRRVLDLIDRGKLHPIVDSTFAFEELPRGLERLQNREAFGKVLVAV